LITVISDGPGWGCVSKNHNDTIEHCYGELYSATTTGVSDVDICR